MGTNDKHIQNWETYYQWATEMKDKGYPNVDPEVYADRMMKSATLGANTEMSRFAQQITKE